MSKNPRLQLTVRDHTRVIQALMKHSEELGPLFERRSATGGDPSVAALVALRRMPGVAPSLVRKIGAVIKCAPLLKAAARKVPAKVRAEARRLMTAVHAQKGVRAKLRYLRRVKASGQHAQQPGLAVGVDVAIAILEDGMATIYSSRHPFYKKLSRRPGAKARAAGAVTGVVPPSPAPDPVANQDVEGALIGGAIGGIAGAALGGSVAGPVGAIGGGLTLGAGGALVGASIWSGRAVLDFIRKLSKKIGGVS